MSLLIWLYDRLKGHWETLATLVAAMWGWIAWQQSRQVDTIDKAADAVHQQVKRLAIEQGTAAAHMAVQETYRAELQQLNDQEVVKAATLMHDPAALARYIVQLTGSGRFPSATPPNVDPPV